MADQPFNIAQRFKDNAEQNPEFPAIVAADITLSYGKLWKTVQVFALRMQQRGVDQNAIVAYNTNDIIVSVAIVLASSLLGARIAHGSVSYLNSDMPKPTHLFKSAEIPESFHDDTVIVDQSWTPNQGFRDVDPKQIYSGYLSADDAWLILSTSGTTGRPKYFGLSQKMVFDRSAAVRADFTPHTTRFCSLFPYTSRPFFARFIAALLNNCTLIDSMDPRQWQTLNANLICGSPKQVLEMAREMSDGPKIDRVEVSGAAISDDAKEMLLTKFNHVTDVYGSSETSKSFANVITISPAGQLNITGKPLDSEVQIVDAHGHGCKFGAVGAVRVRNGYMIEGYFNNIEANKSAFKNGWFYPGDKARWTENGALKILGRDDDMVNVEGQKVSLALIDETLCKIDWILEAASFAQTENEQTHVTALIVTSERPSKEDLDAAIGFCFGVLGKALVLKNLITVDNVPKTTKGTPDRKACVQLALAKP